MKPANGTYLLSYKPGMQMKVTVEGDVLHTPYGDMDYRATPPDGFFRESLPDFGVRFTSPTDYVAVYGPDGYAGTYAPVPP